MKKIFAIIFAVMITFGYSGIGSCSGGGSWGGGYSSGGGGSWSGDMESQYDDSSGGGW